MPMGTCSKADEGVRGTARPARALPLVTELLRAAVGFELVHGALGMAALRHVMRCGPPGPAHGARCYLEETA